MALQNETGLGRRFYVVVAGKTNGAHQSIVEKLRSVDQVQVFSQGDCDYLLVICPIVSRTLTDITEALGKIQSNRPVILVVMHHTFDSDYITAESGRQVQNPNVRLTVDYLFYQQEILNCNRNKISWYEIQKVLGVAASRTSGLKTLIEYVKKHKYTITVSFVVVASVTAIVSGTVIAALP